MCKAVRPSVRTLSSAIQERSMKLRVLYRDPESAEKRAAIAVLKVEVAVLVAARTEEFGRSSRSTVSGRRAPDQSKTDAAARVLGLLPPLPRTWQDEVADAYRGALHARLDAKETDRG